MPSHGIIGIKSHGFRQAKVVSKVKGGTMFTKLRAVHIAVKDVEEATKEYGERFWRAIRVVGERGVNKYSFQPSGQVVWIVAGKSREYLISLEDKYCTCDDFYMNVVLKKKSDACYHILAKMIAVSLNIYNTYDVEDERYPILMEEWKQI